MLIVSTRQPIGVNATRTAVTDKIIASRELIAFNKILDATRPILRVNFGRNANAASEIFSGTAVVRRFEKNEKKERRKGRRMVRKRFSNKFVNAMKLDALSIL